MSFNDKLKGSYWWRQKLSDYVITNHVKEIKTSPVSRTFSAKYTFSINKYLLGVWLLTERMGNFINHNRFPTTKPDYVSSLFLSSSSLRCYFPLLSSLIFFFGFTPRKSFLSRKSNTNWKITSFYENIFLLFESYFYVMAGLIIEQISEHGSHNT